MSITLRPEVQVFAEAMELKLRENDHKGGWFCTDSQGNRYPLDNPYFFLKRIIDENNELIEAVNRATGARPTTINATPEQRQAVLREAADVANFAMMVADVCGGLEEKA